MRRAARVGLTVVIVVLCLSAQPIASAEASTTSNSTNSEFQNATTLDGLVIEGDQVVLDSTITTITQDHGRVRYGPEIGDMDGSETFDTSNIDAVTDVEIEGRQIGGGTFILADVGVDSDVYTGPLEYPDTSLSTDNISTNTAVGNTTDISWTVSDNTNDDGEIGDITLTGVKKPETATYTGAVHDAEDVQDATVTFAELTNAEAIITVEANDGTGWAEIASTTTSNAGTKTLNISNSQADKHRISIDFSKVNAGGVTKVALTEEGVTFDGHIPSLSNPKPTDAVYNSPVTLSVDVTDADFGRVQNDSLTVEFRDGSGATIGTDTLTSNGTVTATYSDPVAGRNDWSVTVTDVYENTATAGPITFRTPAELEIRDEQNPGTLITNPGSAEVRFYTDSDQVYTRSPSNGTISLAGLPADETFVAAVSVEGYETRTITIDSLLEQQTAYLLDANATAAEVDFELNDQTNQFPADQTTLFVQRAITRDNSTAWRTIVGERFGATGTVPTTLAAGDRYRLKVRNRDGDMRALGSYVAAGAAIEPLRIGQVTFQGAQDSGASFSSRFDSTSESEAVDLRYVDPSGDTDELNVTVRRQDANNTVVFQDSISGPINTYRERIPTSALSGHTDSSTYKVEYSAARAGSAVPISGNRTIGDVPSVAKDWPIDAQFLNIAGYLTVLALFGAMVILSPRHAGLVGSATAFALSIMGVIAINSLVLSFALVVSGLFAVGGES